MDKNDQTFLVDEVAKRFKVKNRTVYEWIYKGELIAFKVGNNIRITESSIQLFIEESSQALKKMQGR